MADPTYQQLHGVNVSANLGEALQARVKDPLWFLARQWQSGEFEAENGGRIAYAAIQTAEHPLTSVSVGDRTSSVDPHTPLEKLIESELGSGDAPGWQSEALEYRFAAEINGLKLRGDDYAGRALDWYQFDVEGGKLGAPAATRDVQVTPTQLYFPGAPDARWWTFEAGDAYFDEPVDPEPNALSMLLPEFFYADIDNWYVVPLDAQAGTLCEIRALSVVDSFGVVTSVAPVAQQAGNWRIFALDSAEGSSQPALDGRFLFVPNVALELTHNDDIEEVRLFRDENANLVWAMEFRYTDENGDVIVNDGANPAPGSSASDLPEFHLTTPVPDHWIPYVPRQIPTTSAQPGQIHLRRGRTREDATEANPQYKGRLVAESKILNEEEVPRYGLRVRRLGRYARGSDGTPHFWVGRIKEATARIQSPGLRFDTLDDQ